MTAARRDARPPEPRPPAATLLRGTLPGESAPIDVLLCDGRVRRVSRKPLGTPDRGNGDCILAPTLCDIQVNGAGGVSLQSGDLGVDALVALNAFMARWGVSRWVPTLITGPLDTMEDACRVIAEARRIPALRRAMPGIHLEGPWISPEDGPRGAHPRAHVRAPDLRAFNRLMRASDDAILYTTISPEWPEAPRFIRALAARGVVSSLGHHMANAEQIRAAADAGARLCTHLGNGIHPQLHRHFNPIWPQLADDRLAASFIADGHHVPPAVLKAMLRAKGAGNAVLVSDCVEITGLKPGRYQLFGADVELRRDGRICLLGTELLAGSGRMLIDGVFYAAQHGGLTLPQAFAAATINPARVLGLPASIKPLRAGAVADSMLVEPRPRGAKVHGVWIGGKAFD